MPSERSPEAVLLHIRDNIVFARELIGDLTAEQFEHDRMRFYAATRCLEIVSEAVRRLPEDLRERHPDMPWRLIMDAGNFYRHAYEGVDERIVFATVRESLPELEQVVSAELGQLEQEDGGS